MVEVVRHEDGTLWVFWRIEGKDPLLDFPTGPRCVPPEDIDADVDQLRDKIAYQRGQLDILEAYAGIRKGEES